MKYKTERYHTEIECDNEEQYKALLTLITAMTTREGVGPTLYQCQKCENKCYLITPIQEDKLQSHCITGYLGTIAYFGPPEEPPEEGRE